MLRKHGKVLLSGLVSSLTNSKILSSLDWYNEKKKTHFFWNPGIANIYSQLRKAYVFLYLEREVEGFNGELAILKLLSL